MSTLINYLNLIDSAFFIVFIFFAKGEYGEGSDELSVSDRVSSSFINLFTFLLVSLQKILCKNLNNIYYYL